MDHVEIEGLRLAVPVGVFHPVLFKSSAFFARYLSQLPLNGQQVLDVGCGSGVLALVMAQAGARVTAADLHEEAVRATIENASMNGLVIDVVHSDLFSSIDGAKSFALIVWNPPFYEGRPDSVADHAWWAGEGLQTIERFAQTAARHLAPEGRILMSVSSEMNLPLFRSILAKAGWQVKELSSRRWLFEELFIYEIRPVS